MPADNPAIKPDPPAPGKSRKLLIPIIIVAVLAIGGGTTWFFVGGKDQVPVGEDGVVPGKVPPQAHYLALDPAFVVNVASPAGSDRFLQAEVQLMTRDPKAVALIETHAPAIRARLLMLFSQQDLEGLQTRAGKEKLQAAALAEVRNLLVEETGKPGADALLFTSFVMQ